jgi:hypothetical protein
MMIREQLRERRGGFALALVILGTVVLSGLTLAALKMGSDEASAARATRVSASALYVAESAVPTTQVNWPSATMAALNPGDSADLGLTTLDRGSSYRRIIHRRDGGADTNNRLYSLTVEGRTYGPLGGQATVQVWLTTRAVSNSKFNAAISARNSITLSGNDPGSYTDSYDSRLGDYNALLAGGSRNVEASGDVQ